MIAFAATQYDEYKIDLENKAKLRDKKANLRSEISYRLDTELFKKFFELKTDKIENNYNQVTLASYPTTEIAGFFGLPPRQHGEVALSQVKASTNFDSIIRNLDQLPNYLDKKQELSDALLKVGLFSQS